MKKTLLFTSILLMGATLVGCGANNTASNDTNTTPGAGGSAQQTIVVGADTTFPPFESEQNGQVTGFDIAMVQDIAKLENLKISSVKTMTFTGLIPALQSGAVQVAVAGMTIKQTRMDAVNFSNAYYKSGLSILVKSGSSVKSLSDLKDKVVATKKGTSSVDLLKSSNVKNIKQYDNIDDAYNSLKTGGADAVVFDNPVNINFKNLNQGYDIVGGLLTGEYYGIAVTKDDAGLLAKINDGLAKMQANGDYAKLFDTYLGGDKNGLVDGVKDPASVAVQDKK
jgi:glutamine transport system substrate-binding protein